MAHLPKSLHQNLDSIARLADILWRRGWAERNAGNLSWRLDSPARSGLDRDMLLVTVRNSRMRDLAREPESALALLAVNFDTMDFQQVAGTGEPTSEISTHLRLHRLLKRKHPTERSILHTHPRYLTAITHHPDFRDENTINALLRAMHPEISLFLWEGVGWTPFRRPGGPELAEVVETALTDHPLALLDRHGVIAVGKTPDDALDRIDLAERAIEMWFLCRSAGFSPLGLSQAELDTIAAHPSK